MTGQQVFEMFFIVKGMKRGDEAFTIFRLEPFLHELRKIEKGRSVPVVVVTAKDLTADEMAELSGNVQEIFRKDEFKIEDILTEIGRLTKST